MRILMFTVFSFVVGGSVLAEEQELSWIFRSGSSEGYSIEPLAVDPTPGSPVCAGANRQFRVKVAYTLEISDKGKIVMVFQNQDNQIIPGGDTSQVSNTVERGKGEVILADVITIPEDQKEVWLFVPIVPEGLELTFGELVIPYPLAHCL